MALRRARAVELPTPTPASTIPGKPVTFDRNLLLVMLGVAVGFAVVIGAGFLVFGQDGGRGFELTLLHKIVIGAVTLALTLLLARPKRPRRIYVNPAPVVSAEPAESSCAHLRPIEMQMRAEGIAVRDRTWIVEAKCRVDPDWTPPAPIAYREFFQPERHPEDNPTAVLTCTACNKSIEAVHPSMVTAATPIFPNRGLALQGTITAIAVSPDGRWVAVAAGENQQTTSMWILDGASQAPVHSFPTPGVIRSLAWTPDSRLVFAGRGELWDGGRASAGPSIFAFDGASGREVLQLGSDLFGIRSIAVSADGRMLLSSSRLSESRAGASAIDLWDAVSGQHLRRIASQVGDQENTYVHFTGVAFSPDVTHAYSGSGWGSASQGLGLRCWRLSDGVETPLLDVPAQVISVSISGDGERLFAAGQRIYAFDLQARRMIWERQSWTGYPVAVSRDGSLLACGTGTKEDNHGPWVHCGVDVFDASSRAQVRRFEHHTPPEAVAFGPGFLVAGGRDGELRFWKT